MRIEQNLVVLRYENDHGMYSVVIAPLSARNHNWESQLGSQLRTRKNKNSRLALALYHPTTSDYDSMRAHVLA